MTLYCSNVLCVCVSQCRIDCVFYSDIPNAYTNTDHGNEYQYTLKLANILVICYFLHRPLDIFVDTAVLNGVLYTIYTTHVHKYTYTIYFQLCFWNSTVRTVLNRFQLASYIQRMCRCTLNFIRKKKKYFNTFVN